jgi:GAF domain-containing protein
VDAVAAGSIHRSSDLAADPRWPEFAQQAVARTGIRSIMSFRMYFESTDLAAALNVYAVKPFAFDDDAETIGLLLATHGALALSSARAYERADNLERALATNRQIGVAMGILMARHIISSEQAFDLLRIASQHSHRKLASIARDVVETGDVDMPALRPPRSVTPMNSRRLRAGPHRPRARPIE